MKLFRKILSGDSLAGVAALALAVPQIVDEASAIIGSIVALVAGLGAIVRRSFSEKEND